MAGRGSERRRMPREVLVRLTDALAATTEANAALAGLTPPAWIRSLVAAAGGAPAAEAVPTPRRRGRPHLASADVLAVDHLREVVAELGGALTVAAVDTREQGLPILHHEVERLIPPIKSAARDLLALKQTLERLG